MPRVSAVVTGDAMGDLEVCVEMAIVLQHLFRDFNVIDDGEDV